MGLNDDIRPAVKMNTPAVTMNDSLRTAIEKISENNCSALIVKSGKQLVGIVTDMDLMDGVVRYEDLDQPKVADFMTACELITEKPVKSPCVQLHEGESVKNALDVMSTAGVHNLLVSCEMGVGTCMVSVRDLLRLTIA